LNNILAHDSKGDGHVRNILRGDIKRTKHDATVPGQKVKSHSPVSLASAILLGLLWISVHEAILAKELWKKLLVLSDGVGITRVITVVVLVGASHYTDQLAIAGDRHIRTRI
jgi:hypothetical protein